MTDSPKNSSDTDNIRPRRHHSGSMPILSRRWLPAVIKSDNLPVRVAKNLPVRRRKSGVVSTNKDHRE